MHQRDIRFICDSNPMFLDDEKNVYNMDRVLMLGECFHSLGLDYPQHSFDYPNIKANSNFLEYITTVRYEALFGSDSNCLFS